MKLLQHLLFAVCLFLLSQAIQGQLQALLQATTPTDQNHGCIHFSPYVQQFNPNYGTHPPTSLIEQLLTTLRDQTKFRCIITYGVLNTLGHIVPAARDRGFKVILVPWLSTDTAVNEQSVDAAISLTRQFNETVFWLLLVAMKYD